MASNSLPTILKDRAQFQHLFQNGKRLYPHEFLIINYIKNQSGETRYGWTVPKFVGNAVVRNRFKRWCREYVRCHKSDLEQNHFDVNFVVKRNKKGFYKSVSHEQFDQALKKAFNGLKKVN